MTRPWRVSALPVTRQQFWWSCFALLALSFIPSLGFHFIGEEAILPLTSLEMWHRGDWLKHTIYGLPVGHNPLFNWLLIPLASAAGWEHALLLSRALMLGSCLLTAFILAGLARRLFGDPSLGAFAAVVYLSLGDLFLWRGALAYVDPLFGLFVFGSIAALWLACEGRSPAWLLAAMTALTAAFLTKTLTAYVFYGAAGFVMLFRREYRLFLLSPASIAVHAAGLAAAAYWLLGVVGGQGHGGWMLQEALRKLVPQGLGAYLLRLVAYPAETLLRLSPPSALALYLLWRGRVTAPEPAPARAHFWTAVAMAGLNFLPYWLAPQGGIRYLIPIYPLFAMVIARMIWRAGEDALRLAVRWLVALLAVKLVFVLVAYPHYQATYRGENYLAAAEDVMARVGDRPLYVNDLTATGLSVAAHLDIRRLPAPPLGWPPESWNDAFLLTETPQAEQDRVVTRYRLGGDDLYLVCRGSACDPLADRRIHPAMEGVAGILEPVAAASAQVERRQVVARDKGMHGCVALILESLVGGKPEILPQAGGRALPGEPREDLMAALAGEESDGGSAQDQEIESDLRVAHEVVHPEREAAVRDLPRTLVIPVEAVVQERVAS